MSNVLCFKSRKYQIVAKKGFQEVTFLYKSGLWHKNKHDPKKKTGSLKVWRRWADNKNVISIKILYLALNIPISDL